VSPVVEQFGRSVESKVFRDFVVSPVGAQSNVAGNVGTEADNDGNNTQNIMRHVYDVKCTISYKFCNAENIFSFDGKTGYNVLTILLSLIACMTCSDAISIRPLGPIHTMQHVR